MRIPTKACYASGVYLAAVVPAGNLVQPRPGISKSELKPLCYVEEMAASEVDRDLERLLLKYMAVTAEPYKRQQTHCDR